MMDALYKKARMLWPRGIQHKPIPRCLQCGGVVPFDRCLSCGWCRLEATLKQDEEGLGDLVPVEPSNP